MRSFSQINQHPALRVQRFPEHLWPRGADAEGVEEGWVLDYFAESARLGLDSAPIKLQPPMPDLECIVGGKRMLFEVSEILDDRLAQGADHSVKQSLRRMEAVSRGDLETANSIQTWGFRSFPRYASLERILRQKLSKKYCTTGIPTQLLLFYDQQTPQGPLHEPLDYLLSQHQEWASLLANSAFQRVWIFHLPLEFVIGYLEVAPDGTLAVLSSGSLARFRPLRSSSWIVEYLLPCLANVSSNSVARSARKL